MNWLKAGISALAICASDAAMSEEQHMKLSPTWRYVADTVMGGVSTGQLDETEAEGETIARLTGLVSLDNNGGFVQMAFDLQSDGAVFDASAWTGIALTVRGNSEVYDLRLRTDALTRPWQSYRLSFKTTPEWTELRLPFSQFEPNRTEAPFDPAKLRRIGILAIGREFAADVSVSQIGFYR